MKKLIIGTVAALAALPMLASAATIPATTVFTGQTQAWGNAGQSVTATFRVNVAAGEVVHAIRTKVDSQATVCLPIGPFEGAQDVDVSVNLTLPPNSNASGYNLTAELFTTATLPEAEAMTGNLACTGANTNAYNGSNVLHVLPTSGTSVGTPSGGLSDLMALIAALQKQIADLKNPPVPPAPVIPSACVTLAAKMSGAMYGVTTPQNGILQGFLIGEGMSIPALQSNKAPYGFWGPQTQAAVSAYKAAHACI